jgi:hypothetical protein
VVYCGDVTTEIDSAQFRAVLGHVPTSVVVVTGVEVALADIADGCDIVTAVAAAVQAGAFTSLAVTV